MSDEHLVIVLRGPAMATVLGGRARRPGAHAAALIRG